MFMVQFWALRVLAEILNSAEWFRLRHKDSTYLLASCPMPKSILYWLQPSLAVVWKRTNQGSSNWWFLRPKRQKRILWNGSLVLLSTMLGVSLDCIAKSLVVSGVDISAVQINKFLFDLSYVISTSVWLRTECTKSTCSVYVRHQNPPAGSQAHDWSKIIWRSFIIMWGLTRGDLLVIWNIICIMTK